MTRLAAALLLALAASSAAGRPHVADAGEQDAILEAARTAAGVQISACGVLLDNVDLFDADLEGGVIEDAASVDVCCRECQQMGCGAFTYDAGMKR